jgi:tetratricopeptide (TPR) repeat protein
MLFPSKHPPSTSQEERIGKKELPEERPRSREIAALHLTEQGKMLLESGKIDDAISVLERAVSIYGTNGKNYYYLAEAWLKKGNIMQARDWRRCIWRGIVSGHSGFLNNARGSSRVSGDIFLVGVTIRHT